MYRRCMFFTRFTNWQLFYHRKQISETHLWDPAPDRDLTKALSNPISSQNE